jgi:hypothetical protein
MPLRGSSPSAHRRVDAPGGLHYRPWPAPGFRRRCRRS